MANPLPYVRPVFIEHQKLIAGKSGVGYASILLIPLLVIITPFFFPPALGRVPLFAIPLAAVGLLAPLICLAGTLTTIVEADQLRLSLRLGQFPIWRRLIRLSDILSCDILTPGQSPAATPLWKLPKFKGVSLLKSTSGTFYFAARGNHPAIVLTTGRFAHTVIGSQRLTDLAAAITAGLSP